MNGTHSTLLRRLGFLVLALGLLCAASVTRAEVITLYAAASTVDIMTLVARKFEDDTGHRVRLSVAASSALARQIEAGAPADIYLSANVRWMDYLAERDLIEADSRRNLLRNGLVLIAPANGTVGDAPLLDAVYPFSDLIADGRLAMADPDHVPAGIYGRQALKSVGAWPALRDRLARAQNVRAALVLVARGEAPAGIVYRTDALATDDVRIIGRFPDDSHDPIVYPVSAVKGRQSPATNAFLAYLDRPESRAVFRRHGFKRPAG